MPSSQQASQSFIPNKCHKSSSTRAFCPVSTAGMKRASSRQNATRMPSIGMIGQKYYKKLECEWWPPTNRYCLLLLTPISRNLPSSDHDHQQVIYFPIRSGPRTFELMRGRWVWWRSCWWQIIINSGWCWVDINIHVLRRFLYRQILY